MQFIKQNHPSMYNIDNTLHPEIELDISSLIRFKKLIELRERDEINPTQESNNYILVASTKLKKSLEYQKPAFIKVGKNAVNVIIENNKIQYQFLISGFFQIECLYDLIINIIEQLGSSHINYDITKNYGNTVESKPIVAPYISPTPGISPFVTTPAQPDPYVVPNPAWSMPTPIMCSNVPPPNVQPGNGNVLAPPNVTTSVIPQMPNIPAAPKI